jgi:acetate CoA/acetoacetate CoA-transferase alpha subunit
MALCPAAHRRFGFVYADRADMVGNLAYTLTELNFNPAIAMAAETVFAETRVIVPVGAIAPDDVRTPGIVIDHLITRA